jgi:benzoyl-CoA reductase/2-hydroxyglutaryl-CoA dehydratase subunit BcrC/BadD/HgdB
MSQEFTSLQELRRLTDDHQRVLTATQQPVIGWFCAYTPVEILVAAGLQPYRIVPAPGRAINTADGHIERNFCPYVRTCLGEALEGNYRFLDGLVVVNSCDAMRRLYDVWRHYLGGFVTLLDLPRTDSEAAVAYHRECLGRLAGEMEAHFGLSIEPEAMTRAIDARNQARRRLKELYRRNLSAGLPLSSVDVHAVVRASNMLPVETFGPILESLLVEVGNTSGGRRGPRVLVSGSIMDNPGVLEIIEGSGAVVVGDDLCTGTRQLWELVEAGPDPLTALSRYYLGRTPCPRMKEARRRFDHVFRLVDEFGADGVIFYTLKFCDPFLFDVPVLKARLAERGIPGLLLESDYSPGTLGRVRTRLQAFIEMLGQNVRTA